MRNATLPLLALASALLLNAQESAITQPSILKDLSIPVELSKTIKAERVRPGDPVKLRMAEPILAGKNTVIPREARLFGRVVHARPATPGKLSHLSIVVERAEWRGHMLPLRAFVVGWGTRRIQVIRPCGPSFGTPPPSRNGSSRRANSTFTIGSGDPIFDDCARGQRGNTQYVWNQSTARPNVSIFRNVDDGVTLMVSKKNIHLRSGSLMMLRNMDPSEVSSNRETTRPGVMPQR